MAATPPPANPPMDLREGGAKFRNRVINPLMFRAYMLAKMPVLGVTGTYLDEINTHHCVATLPCGWTTKNLFGQTFNAAVLAAAETASVALLVLHIRNQDADVTPDVVEIDSRFGDATLEELQLRCDDGARYADFVARARHTDEPIEETFTVVVNDEHGETVHEVDLTWRLS